VEPRERWVYHDGRFATLRDVVKRYDGIRHLSESEKVAPVEYFKSL
jgi:hypothetical protein